MTVEAILEATLQLLLAQGMRRLTTTAIAARAGVSVGTLYQYYPDKQAIFTALWLRFLARAEAALAAAHGTMRGQPTEAAVRALVAGLVAFKRDNLDAILALREPMASLDGARWVTQLVEAFYRLACTIVDDPMRARVLTSALDGALDHAIAHEPGLLREAQFEAELTTLAVRYAVG